MTYPSSGGTPDPYQPPQPYGQDPTAVPGYPTSGQPAPGYPTSGQPSPGYPTSGQPASGYPTTGQPSPGYPTTGQPASGYPTTGQPGSGYPGYSPGLQPEAGYPSPYQGGPQPYYGAPGYGYAGPQARTNPLAIASLVCSVGGLVTCISAPVGIVLGHIAKRQIRETGEQGEGMATAGLWVGYIVTLLAVLGLLAWLGFVVFAVSQASDTTY